MIWVTFEYVVIGVSLALVGQDLESYLNTIMSLATNVTNGTADHNNLNSFGKAVLDVNKQLVSVDLMKTYNNIKIVAQNLGMQTV